MEKYLPILRKCALFYELSDHEILPMLHCVDAKTQKRDKNEYILRAGGTTNEIGLLAAGAAWIIQEDLWGNRNVMAKLSPGELFAEPFAVIPNSILNVSVVAAEPCDIIKIEITRLMTMCSSACAADTKGDTLPTAILQCPFCND